MLSVRSFSIVSLWSVDVPSRCNAIINLFWSILDIWLLSKKQISYLNTKYIFFCPTHCSPSVVGCFDFLCKIWWEFLGGMLKCDRAYMGALFWHLSSLQWVCMCVCVWQHSDMCWSQSAGRFYLQTRLACGKTKWKKGFAIKLPGIIYCALCDVPAKQIWWHWFDREKSDREKRGIGVSEGWRVDGRSIFLEFPFFILSDTLSLCTLCLEVRK